MTWESVVLVFVAAFAGSLSGRAVADLAGWLLRRWRARRPHVPGSLQARGRDLDRAAAAWGFDRLHREHDDAFRQRIARDLRRW